MRPARRSTAASAFVTTTPSSNWKGKKCHRCGKPRKSHHRPANVDQHGNFWCVACKPYMLEESAK